jgi:hypothetical protein
MLHVDWYPCDQFLSALRVKKVNIFECSNFVYNLNGIKLVGMSSSEDSYEYEKYSLEFYEEGDGPPLVIIIPIPPR